MDEQHLQHVLENLCDVYSYAWSTTGCSRHDWLAHLRFLVDAHVKQARMQAACVIQRAFRHWHYRPGSVGARKALVHARALANTCQETGLLACCTMSQVFLDTLR
jgi:hypothetical protein